MVLKLSHRLTIGVWLAAFLTVGAFAAPPEEPSVPHISPAHREFLSRLVRRTFRDKAMGRGDYEPGYVPEALRSLEAEVIARFRRDGYLLAEGAAGDAPVAQATRDAAIAAYSSMAMAMGGQGPPPASINDLLIEIEVVGPFQAIEADIDWTKPRAIDPYIEPGVHGMLLIGPQAHHRFAPSEMFTSDLVLADALSSVAQRILSDPGQIAKTKLYRFRTAHWYQPSSGGAIVSLERGLTLVPQEAVTRQGLDDAIERIASYMVYRQQPSGLFSYQYNPATDRYASEDNLVRQAGAVMAMAQLAKWSRRSAPLAAADVGIRYHLQGLADIPAVDNAAFIATADKRNKLGVTALLTLALAEHPDATKYAATREKLINGMLWLQRPSGMFITAFPPAEELGGQDYFPGEALLALAAQYSLSPSGDIVEAFDRAIAFYRVYFKGSPSPAFVPWQVQAFARMAKHGKRRDYADYVFELTDWLAARQLDESNNRWPDLWGGIAAYQPGRVGVATAAYLEGFADALTLAREVGDRQRAERYEQVVRRAARFVMQLQVRQEEAYFVRSRQDAVGGIRTAPALNLLRIDHCQHALVALIKTRRVLFGDDR